MSTVIVSPIQSEKSALDQSHGPSKARDKLDTMKHVNEIVTLLSSGTPVGKLILSQINRIIDGKMKSNSDSFSSFVSTTGNPLIRLLSKSPTIMVVIDMVDKGASTGLISDEMLKEIVEHPEVLGPLMKDLSSLLAQEDG